MILRLNFEPRVKKISLKRILNTWWCFRARSRFKMRQFPNINTQFFHIAVACDWIIFDKYSRKMIGCIMSDSQNPRWIDSFNLIIFWLRFSNFELRSNWLVIRFNTQCWLVKVSQASLWLAETHLTNYQLENPSK